jgi:hypothetical protein
MSCSFVLRKVHAAIGTWRDSRPSAPRPIVSGERRRFASSLAVLIMLGAAPASAAATACVGQPNLRESNDGHWYYRVDRLNHHKCWYLQGESQPVASSPTAPNVTMARVGSSISSFFASWKRSVSIRPQADVATAPAPPEPSADLAVARKSVSPIRNRGWAVSEGRAATLQVHQRQLAPTDQQHELDPAQREELFQEFLRWSLRRE